MIKGVITLILILLSLPLIAQESTSNSDLRLDQELFSIEFSGEKSKVSLSRASSGSHFFVDKSNKRLKLTKKLAEKLDSLFVGEFIEMKYMMGEISQRKCSKNYKLKMRGESFRICFSDKKRMTPLQKLIKKIDTIKG